MAHLIPANHLRRMPWKNGGGSSTELVVHPPGASLADFDWRLSLAEVERDGPFSLFPGIDRCLMLVEGAGMRLALAAGTTIDLRERFGTCDFRGDDALEAKLLAGAVRDCNLMVRRPGRGCLRVVHDGSATIAPAAFRVCHAWRGTIAVRAGGPDVHAISPGDTLLLDEGDAQMPLVVEARDPGTVAIVATIDVDHAVG